MINRDPMIEGRKPRFSIKKIKSFVLHITLCIFVTMNLKTKDDEEDYYDPGDADSYYVDCPSTDLYTSTKPSAWEKRLTANDLSFRLQEEHLRAH